LVDCNYISKEYYDYNDHKTTKHECKLDTKKYGPDSSDRDPTLCIFHDKNFQGKNKSKEYLDAFNKYIKEYNGTGEESPPVYCIEFLFWNKVELEEGFIFWKAVHFSHTVFHEDVKFQRITFNKAANFSDAIFCGKANFSNSKYRDKANFARTTYIKEAKFKNCIFDNEVYFNGTPKSKDGTEKDTEKRTIFKEKADFFNVIFKQRVNFSGVQFPYWKSASASFSHIDFQKEVDFDSSAYMTSIFPNPPSAEEYRELGEIRIPIRFDNTTFRGRVRFVGEANRPLQLGLVSLQGVDLTNVIFQNVKWLKIGQVWRRNAVINELKLKDHMNWLLCKGNFVANDEELREKIKLKKKGESELEEKRENFEEVSSIYNQLRKNYESNLSFHLASDFYIGEMEVTRKEWWQTEEREKEYGKSRQLIREKLKSIVYGVYKYLNLYGESTFVPLLVWSPLIIAIFAIIRIYTGQYEPKTDGIWLDWAYNKFIDSLFAYFQFPRANDDFWGTVERIVSVPILAIAIKSFALTKRFESSIR
jgi:uncharacterized protein YjbI with pentapeptide repeats